MSQSHLCTFGSSNTCTFYHDTLIAIRGWVCLFLSFVPWPSTCCTYCAQQHDLWEPTELDINFKIYLNVFFIPDFTKILIKLAAVLMGYGLTTWVIVQDTHTHTHKHTCTQSSPYCECVGETFRLLCPVLLTAPGQWRLNRLPHEVTMSLCPQHITCCVLFWESLVICIHDLST